MRSSRSSHFGKRYLSGNPKPVLKGYRLLGVVSLALLFSISLKTLEGALRKPQIVLVLGGAPEREVFAADFAKKHPDLPVWISSGSNPEYAEWVFSEAGIESKRVHLDYAAIDTVTNFTTLVDQFKAQGIKSIYLITSDYHMHRARVIGEIVLGSRDITFKTVAVPSNRPPEPIEKVLRDAARSVLWVTTGQTGANFAHSFSHQR